MEMKSSFEFQSALYASRLRRDDRRAHRTRAQINARRH
jgi:hypothetical protein